VVFIDETVASTTMTRIRGHAPQEQRLVGKTPNGHWNVTFVAALRCNRVHPPMAIDRAMNGTIFPGYARRFLLPTLTLGDRVIMDNLPVHKVGGTERRSRVSPPRSCSGAIAICVGNCFDAVL
jgi:hypothetical protein